jgi:hypothetical protein
VLKQPIHLIGVEFSKEQRNLVGFEVISTGSASHGASSNEIR